MGRKAIIVPTDVSHVDHVRAMVDTAKAKFGRVDILVNNAGWTGTTAALDVTEDEYDRTMSSSLKSVFFACQAAARVMIPQGGGRIINIGSNFGVVAFQGRSVYAAAKAGVHHLSRALSLEWAKHGVNVNVVAPCITETDSRRVILERPGYKEWATTQMLPAGRWNQPQDLVGAVLFLGQPDGRHDCRSRPDGGRRMDDPLGINLVAGIISWLPALAGSSLSGSFDFRLKAEATDRLVPADALSDLHRRLSGADRLVLLLQAEADAVLD